MSGDGPIGSIHHVQIAMPVGGEDAARAFYANLLRLIEIEKPVNLRSRGGTWFQTGNLELHLGVDQDFRPARKAHVAFQIKGLDAYRSRLLQAGYAISEDEPLEGFARFYVADPFGNRLELLEPRDATRETTRCETEPRAERAADGRKQPHSFPG